MVQFHMPNQILNETPANAVPVEGNYAAIEQHINDELINRDGSVSMQQHLLLDAGNPTQPKHAATKSYVDQLLPIGIIMPWPAESAPAGSWLLCDGTAYQPTLYPTLYGLIHYTFSPAGTTSGNFHVPNLVGRVIVGLTSAKTEFNAIGDSGGTWIVPTLQHSHTMPHTHTIAHDHGSFNSSDNQSNHTHSINHDHAVSSTGTSTDTHAHDLPLGLNSTPGSVLRPMAGSSTGTVSTTANTGVDSDTHIHSINLPNYVGTSGANSGNHTHSINVPPYGTTTPSGPVSTASTANTGTANAEHLPPYLTLNYIIRAG